MNEAAAASVLFQNQEKSIVVLDIPRSLEEVQVLPGLKPARRIYSAEAPVDPFETPEPKYGAAQTQPPAAQLDSLMTAGRVQSALAEVKSVYDGPFCLPRQVSPGHSRHGSDASDYHIPSHAEYLNGAIQELRPAFLKTAPSFDLIILDPPWPNKSARRKANNYLTAPVLADAERLLRLLPVPTHLDEGGLLAIWTTNKPAVHKLLTVPAGLLASWGLEVVAEWTWVKVTASGEPLYDINANWRKPWEKLLIARRIGTHVARNVKPKMIFAVPDLHSRKPNLRGLFRDIFEKETFAGLEVFARNLTAGWWSWGDEVLKFQESRHWTSS